MVQGGNIMQRIVDNSTEALDAYFRDTGANRIFLVGGRSMDKLAIGKYFSELRERTGIEVVRFSDFKPNPDYTSVLAEHTLRLTVPATCIRPVAFTLIPSFLVPAYRRHRVAVAVASTWRQCGTR